VKTRALTVIILVAICTPAALATQAGSIVGWGWNPDGQATPPLGTNFVAISAGDYHSLALRADGSIVVLGAQSGITPSETGFTAISAGDLHSLALRADGSIVAWGYNDQGQCDVPSGTGYKAIAAGRLHSLALRADGSIASWGYLSYAGTTPPSGAGFVAIAAGMEHALALRADGSIVGWGNNNYGQATPPSGTGFVAIAAGVYHSLALRADGSIVGWGDNYMWDGQGSYIYCGQATPPSGTGFVAIAAGGNHSLALRGDGSIVGWGWNDYGQATPPSGTGFAAIAAGNQHSLALRVDSIPPSPNPMTWSVGPHATSSTSIVMMATFANDVSGAQYYFACTGGGGHDSGWQNTTSYTDTGLHPGTTYSYTVKARDKSFNHNETLSSAALAATTPGFSGTIVGWGANNNGQATPPVGTDFMAIAAGLTDGLALRADGSIVGWGLNAYGEATPPSGTGFTAIAVGGYHSLALRANGSIAGWGSNNGDYAVYYGQATPPSGTGFTAITAGYAHSLALRTDGSIVGWGSNYDTYGTTYYGQATAPLGTGFKAIAAGSYHSLALRADGSIAAWGSNEHGQASPPSGTGFVAIAAGWYHSLALRADGSIVGWGWNQGQSDMPSGTGYKAIVAGGYHSLALRADGGIVGWGENSSGQATPPSGTSFVAIAAGYVHSLALQVDSTPPSPDPMTWSVLPFAKSPTSIGMVATTASDSSGVEYYFTCTSGEGHDSGWQDSAIYTDADLQHGLACSYTVKARDKSPNYNGTAASVEAIAGIPVLPPAKVTNLTPLDNATDLGIFVSLGWSNAEGGAGYDVYLGTTSSLSLADKKASGIMSTTYAAVLAHGTTYYWRIDSVNIVGTMTGDTWHFTTMADTTLPSPSPMTWSVLPHATSASTIAMVATTASDVSGVEYYFTCTGGNGHDSGWQDSVAYTDTGLEPVTTCSYTVRARDKSGNHNETASSAVGSATTPVRTYVISGYLRFSNGIAIAGATVTASGIGETLSNYLGYYAITVPDGWSGTVTPGSVYVFTPLCTNYSNVTSDLTNQDYTGRSPDQIISGYVRDSSGATVIGVTLTTNDGYSCTTGTGEYVLHVPYGWFGTVTPSRSGYYFTPAGLSYNAVTTPRSEQNYLAEPAPALSSVLPADGPAGSVLTLSGSNLGEVQGSVLFGDVAAVVLEWTSISVTCIVPPGAITGNVVLERSDSRVSNEVAFTVTTADILHVSNAADENCQNGTMQYPFKTISGAITAAADGTVIEVDDGVYTGPENRGLGTLGKSFALRSANGPASCVIDCNGLDRGFYFHSGEDANTVVDGFTIVNGYDGGPEATVYGAGIACVGSSPTIRNCVIRNCGGIVGGVYCDSGAPVIRNCVIANNSGFVGGMYASGSSPTIESCTITGNTGVADMGGGILYDFCSNVNILNTILWGDSPCELLLWESTATVSYSCVTGGYAGEGNISVDPLFADANNGDYHLLADSPCIDAGDPNSPWSLEPWPNGGRIDMGAYGNTPGATRRDGLAFVGYQVVSKKRVARTSYEYELALTLQNQNAFNVSDIQTRLVDATVAVTAVIDDSVTIAGIPAGQTVTSTDTFKIVVDRSKLIEPGRLTWQLTYYAVGNLHGSQQTMILSATGLDPIQVTGDITGDGAVDSADLMLLAQQWLSKPGIRLADIAGASSDEGIVNFLDYAVLANHWLEGM
jgi:alpha-tubulin suppressor-like RCC1 family protein